LKVEVDGAEDVIARPLFSAGRASGGAGVEGAHTVMDDGSVRKVDELAELGFIAGCDTAINLPKDCRLESSCDNAGFRSVGHAELDVRLSDLKSSADGRGVATAGVHLGNNQGIVIGRDAGVARAIGFGKGPGDLVDADALEDSDEIGVARDEVVGKVAVCV